MHFASKLLQLLPEPQEFSSGNTKSKQKQVVNALSQYFNLIQKQPNSMKNWSVDTKRCNNAEKCQLQIATGKHAWRAPYRKMQRNKTCNETIFLHNMTRPSLSEGATTTYKQGGGQWFNETVNYKIVTVTREKR